METYEELFEAAKEFGKRSPNVVQWIEWRSEQEALQQEPLSDYFDKMRFFRQNVSRASGRENGWLVEIDEFDCYMQGYKQRWLCALTGDKLEFTRGGTDFNRSWSNPKSCTNDRIDPEECYTIENLQLVTWEANLFKQGFTMEALETLATKLLDHKPVRDYNSRYEATITQPRIFP